MTREEYQRIMSAKNAADARHRAVQQRMDRLIAEEKLIRAGQGTRTLDAWAAETREVGAQLVAAINDDNAATDAFTAAVGATGGFTFTDAPAAMTASKKPPQAATRPSSQNVVREAKAAGYIAPTGAPTQSSNSPQTGGPKVAETRPGQAPIPASVATAKTDPAPTPAPAPSEVEGATGSAAAGTRIELQKTWDEEAVMNSILRGDHFKPNDWNKFNNLAYHWRFFVMPDEDFMYLGSRPKDVKEFYQRIDSYKQVNIAETGVTGYNIGEVEMTSVYQDTAAQMTAITMKINEPNGVSFLDSLRQAAREAEVFNYLEFFYYLELSFMGYDIDGRIVTEPFDELPNGGRWIWTVKITDIQTNLNSGGGQYVLTLLPMQEHPLSSEYSTVLDTMTIRGTTIKEMLDDFQKHLNESWAYHARAKDIITHSFKVHGIPPSDPSYDLGQSTPTLYSLQSAIDHTRSDGPSAAETENAVRNTLRNGVDASTILNVPVHPQDEDWQSIRTRKDFAVVQPRSKTNDPNAEAAPPTETKPTANIPRGYSVMEAVTSLFGQCEQFQSLAKDSHCETYGPDEEAGVINSKGFRECVTWHVVPEVKFKSGSERYDFYTNRYCREIIWHIYPRIDQSVILSRLQISQAFDSKIGGSVQQKMLTALAARGFLPKRYDYLFTGINTEVLNFDLNFNMAWQVTLPRLESYYSDQAQQHATFNAKAGTWTDPLTQFEQVSRAYADSFDELKADVDKYNSLTHEQRLEDAKAGENSLRRKIEREQGIVDDVGARVRDARVAADNARKEAERQARETFGGLHDPEKAFERDYIERLNRLEREQGRVRNDRFANAMFPLIPFSFTQGDQSKEFAGLGGTGQWHSGRSLYGSILNQQFGPVTGKFQSADLTIRGDPFWLGQGSFERVLELNEEIANPQKGKLITGLYGPNCLLFRFKYPLGQDEFGNTLLKDNETVTGIYKIVQIKNRFVGGQFTQELHGNRIPLIDLFSAIFGLNQAEEIKEKPESLEGGAARIKQEAEKRADQQQREQQAIAQQAQQKEAERKRIQDANVNRVKRNI